MRYIIDHFEEKFAVCEDEKGNLVDIKKVKSRKQLKKAMF